MPELLKNFYNRDYLNQLAADIRAVYAGFQTDAFVESIMNETWDSLELKGRMRQITQNLGEFLPSDYQTAIEILDKVIVTQGSWLDGFALFFPDFVEVYGQAESDWETSIAALARYTAHASAEFAVRPFIISQQARMMEQMYAWSKSENEHVRRLSCEGCRPALPWAQALPAFKADPTPILPILEQLKNDEALYVRKSVANNLNDISKTHPNLVAKLAKKWYGKNERTDWIVKHGCRTLLKAGNREVLEIFGFSNADCVDVSEFKLDKSALPIGGELTFSFDISTKSATKVRLEYGVDYMKSNGKRNRKIFQISEISMNENQRKPYSKKHSFKDVSTRKHYAGLHSITLIVNGAERGTLDFELEQFPGK